jgi:hypothetical protein
MTILFPADIIPEVMHPMLVDGGDITTSQNGSVTKRISRQQRFKFQVNFPVLDVDQGRRVNAAMMQANGDSLQINIPPRMFDQPLVGTTSLVNTLWNDVSGFGLSVKGLIAGVAIPESIFVSIKTGGVWYLYMTGAVAASGATRTITISSVALVAHQVNDEVRIQEPVFEGVVDSWNGMNPNAVVHHNTSFTLYQK